MLLILLQTRTILPPDFDRTKKYPVFIYVYGGPHAKAANTIYVFDGDDEDTVKLSDIEDAVVRIYLGNISVNKHVEEDWFACDVARRVITGIDHQDLDGKMMYFVKKVG